MAIKPMACPISTVAELPREPVMPEGAGIVQPVTDQEKQATEEFLLWLFDYGAWAREAAARLGEARAWCVERMRNE